MYSPIDRCQLFEGEAADVLRRFPARSIDVCYCDPPFGTEQNWKGKAGSFSDKWQWNERADAGWKRLDNNAASVMHAACASKPKSFRAYIGVMAGLLIEIQRVLRPTGTLWLHFDDTAGAYLRLLSVVVFGRESEAGTLVWKRTLGGHGNAKSFGRIHDTIACYAKSRAAMWRLWRLDTVGGDPLDQHWYPRFDDFAAAEPLAQGSAERIGYPTQKPIALLEEILRASSLPDEIVLDPTCGSGTTLCAAQKLGRRAIGIDASATAIDVARKRLATSPLQQFDMFASAG